MSNFAKRLHNFVLQFRQFLKYSAVLQIGSP